MLLFTWRTSQTGTFKRVITTTLNGNIVGSVDVPSSGNVVAKDQLETPFDVTGLTELSASMKFQLPSVESGEVVVSMIVRVALQGGGDAAPSAPTMDVESPMIGQFGVYQETISLPAGAQSVTEVRMRIDQKGAAASTQTMLLDDIKLSAP